MEEDRAGAVGVETAGVTGQGDGPAPPLPKPGADEDPGDE